MPKPNFFIVGAPKCGTTAMYTFLKQHPDIFMPDWKEPHFFGQDVNIAPQFKRVTDLDQYLALFQPGEGKKRLGEASTQYLRSETAAQEIKDFAPDALIIIMLRNPVDRVYSGYFQRRYVGTETAPTFELDVQARRDRALYTGAVRRYFDVFGRERVHVIIHDDMLADLTAVYRATLQFLEVDPDFQPVFEVVNPNKETRSAALRQLLSDPPGWYRALRGVGRALLPAETRKPVNRFIWRANTRYTKRAPMNPDTRRELQLYFRPDVERLSELLGRDLTHWCQ